MAQRRAYRHVGTIQSCGTSLDARGQRVQTWSTFATCHYGREEVSGGETFRGRQVAAESSCVLSTHWIDGVTPKMRMVDGSRTYQFLAIRDQYDNRRTLEIDAKEIA